MTPEQKSALLAAARLLIELVNKDEEKDGHVSWRPWVIVRHSGPKQ